MRATAAFGLAAGVLIAVVAAVLARIYDTPDEVRSIVVSAVVAFGVQLLTFALLKLAGPKNVMAAWGVGAIVRLVTLVVYMVVIVSAVGLTANAPLFLAVFLFLTMVIEPLLLTL
ncbi:MAG TPA: hypothetical protein VK922_18600 [Gemmatimonadaceae bacterium]|nr:hypothetical protein [Gemmatimonadaceae bacterium]